MNKIIPIIIIVFLYAPLKAQNKKTIEMSLDVNDADGVLYNEKYIQTYIEVRNLTPDTLFIPISWEIRTDRYKPLYYNTIKKTLYPYEKRRIYCPIYEFPDYGFYILSANISLKNEESHYAQKVVGIDPEKINVPLTRRPDFDSFWEKAIEELNQIAPKYKITPVKRGKNSKTKLYEVEMKSIGNLTVKGWLEVPKKRGKYPALLRVNGYTENLQPIDKYDDLIVFSFNTRDHGNSDNTGPREYDMWVRNMHDKNSYYYKGLFIDCIRAMDYLYSRKDVDTSRIAIWGGSQGGGLAFSTAALDSRVSLCIADIPFLCDLKGYYEMTHWDEVDRWFEKHPEQTWTTLMETMSYFETINMAHRIKCPVYMGIGLQDDTCPPASSFPTYNRLNCKKYFNIYKNCSHWQPDSHYESRFKTIRKEFKMD